MNTEREVKIYQKVDYIQSLILNEIRIKSTEDQWKPISQINTPNVNLLSIKNHDRSQSYNPLSDYHNLENKERVDSDKLTLGQEKNFSLNKVFHGYSTKNLTRDLKEPELQYQSFNRKSRRCLSTVNNKYKKDKNEIKVRRTSIGSFTRNRTKESQERIKAMSFMLNPYGARRSSNETKTSEFTNIFSNMSQMSTANFSKSRPCSQFGQHPPPYQCDPFSRFDNEALEYKDKIRMLELLLKEKNEEINILRTQVPSHAPSIHNKENIAIKTK